MAVFGAQTKLNFNTMDEFLSLTHPNADYSGDADSFLAEFLDSIAANGNSFAPNGNGKPTAGTITSLDVDHGIFINVTNAFTITGMSTGFNALLTAINSGGTKGGLELILNGADTVFGSNAGDYLFGFDGNDTVKGGKGKDKLDGGDDSDTVDYSDKNGDVSVTLAGGDFVKVKVNGKVEDTIKNFERVIGGNGDDKIGGDGAVNELTGRSGNDNLSGKGGLDFLHGGDGNDKLKGGSFIDSFFFDTALNAKKNVDSIADFKVGEDLLVLKDDFFSAISAGEIGGGTFFAINQATTASHHIIYKAGSGNLLYDADGSGAAFEGVLFAKLDKGLGLAAGSFDFIA